MSEIVQLTLAMFAGMVLGAMFFGGLWWTVQNGVASPRPGLWFIVSLMLRTSIALAGFYFVSDGDWKRLLVCLLGFIIARVVVTRLTAIPMAQETGHAS